MVTSLPKAVNLCPSALPNSQANPSKTLSLIALLPIIAHYCQGLPLLAWSKFFLLLRSRDDGDDDDDENNDDDDGDDDDDEYEWAG